MKRFALAMAALLVTAALAVAAAAWYVRTSRPAYDGSVAVRGIEGPVRVWRDSLGVPHVWAGSAEDMVFAQGYVHAQDRLWQMEMFRRVVEGRLAEVLGEGLVETDRFLRTLGLWRAAGVNEERLRPDERRLLSAYAAGVNAWIERRDGALPPEFIVLGVEPEPWTVRHTLAVEKIMAWDLAAYDRGLALARAVRRLGRERAAILFPDGASPGTTILEPGTAAPDADAQIAAEPAPAAATLLDALSMTRASNAWVVGGSRTRSGRPILANDMHLALRAPVLWYLVALHADGRTDAAAGARDAAYDVVGTSIPGAPFVVAGHNRAVAWGFTNAMVDDTDFFIERVDPADPGRYRVPGGSAPFEVVPETIRVRGADEPVVHPVRRTRHGPVITPVEPRAGGELLSLRWAAHDPSETFRAFARFNRAGSWDDFVRAVDAFDDPHQNVVYADTAGHVGYWMAGRVPIRGEGRRPPLLPVPGWTGEWDWTGEIGVERHPHMLDPEQDFVVTANNRQTAGAVAERITARWTPPFRAMRIEELVTAAEAPLDAGAVQRQQLDVRDLMAVRYRDRAAAAAELAGLADAARRLRAWDVEAARDSRAAALFYVWRERLRERAARSLYRGADGWFPAEAVNRVLERRALPWVDADARDAYHEAAAAAMEEAVAVAGGRTWGELHRVAALHSFDDAGKLGDLLERIFGFNVGPAPADGSSFTVNVSHYGGEFPVTSSSGPSQRHVVDMADPDGAGGFILPTGQSGLPFEPQYRDQWERYRSGELWRVPLEREAARARVVHEMILQPIE